jgi:hypothetical protein
LQSIFPFRAIKFKKMILTKNKSFSVQAHNSQLFQGTYLSNSHQKKWISFLIIPILTLTAKNDQELQYHK